MAALWPCAKRTALLLKSCDSAGRSKRHSRSSPSLTSTSVPVSKPSPSGDVKRESSPWNMGPRDSVYRTAIARLWVDRTQLQIQGIMLSFGLVLYASQALRGDCSNLAETETETENKVTASHSGISYLISYPVCNTYVLYLAHVNTEQSRAGRPGRPAQRAAYLCADASLHVPIRLTWPNDASRTSCPTSSSLQESASTCQNGLISVRAIAAGAFTSSNPPFCLTATLNSSHVEHNARKCYNRRRTPPLQPVRRGPRTSCAD